MTWVVVGSRITDLESMVINVASSCSGDRSGRREANMIRTFFGGIRSLFWAFRATEPAGFRRNRELLENESYLLLNPATKYLPKNGRSTGAI